MKKKRLSRTAGGVLVDGISEEDTRRDSAEEAETTTKAVYPHNPDRSARSACEAGSVGPIMRQSRTKEECNRWPASPALQRSTARWVQGVVD